MVAAPKFDEPWAVAVLEYLNDQEWHDYEMMMDKVSSLIPQQEALMKGEYYRRHRYESSGRPVPERQYGGNEATIRTGQRTILSRMLRKLVNHGRVEIEYERRSPKRRTPLRIRLRVL